MTHMHIPHNSIDAGLQLFALLQALIHQLRYFRHSFDPEWRFVFKRAHQRRNADLILIHDSRKGFAVFHKSN